MTIAGKTVKEIRQGMVDETHRVVDFLYDKITPGEPVEYQAKMLAEDMGNISHPGAENRCQELQQLGVLTRTISYGKRLEDGSWKVGRWAAWDLHVTREKAHDLVAQWGARLLAGEVKTWDAERAMRRTKPKEAAKPVATKPVTTPMAMDPVLNMSDLATAKPADEIPTITDEDEAWMNAPMGTPKPALATKPDEETRAIAGPDAPSPLAALASLRKDEPAALVHAARQYAQRDSKVSEHVAALKRTAKELGIEIDEAVFTAGIKMPKDDRLETVGLVLPVIDRLERQVDQLQRVNDELRAKVRKFDEMEGQIRALRGQNERLIAKVASPAN